MNSYNRKLAEKGRKRRAMLLRMYNRGNVTQKQLAHQHGISRQRIGVMLRQAQKELK